MAGIAACVKYASEAADQVEVASVLKSKGLKMRVAGNSFIVNKNTNAAPINMPGLINGVVT